MTGLNETTFKWVNRYFDMIKHGLGDRNITLSHRVLVNFPVMDPVIAMWGDVVNVEPIIDWHVSPVQAKLHKRLLRKVIDVRFGFCTCARRSARLRLFARKRFSILNT